MCQTMYYVKFFWFFVVFHVCCGEGLSDESEQNDPYLNCRDNQNIPVDWWYIYKPPARSFIERGRYFVFLTPYSEGRWQSSPLFITSSSMLLNTLAPMFRKTYKSHLAVAIYTEGKSEKGSMLMGIMMADELGGVWITHTVPGLPDMSQNKALFPEAEIENGHLMTCMTLNYEALDDIMKVLHLAQPNFTHIRIPSQFADQLPTWRTIALKGRLLGKAKVAEFMTRQQKMRPLVVVRKPGDDRCLYKTFAKARKIFLDIYGDRDADHKKASCFKDYGVRKIDSISLKFDGGEVHYINNMTDRAGFAVSTAAHWQRTGPGPAQYWTCTGSYEKEGGLGRGGMLLCVQDYEVWNSFVNLKVAEPTC